MTIFFRKNPKNQDQSGQNVMKYLFLFGLGARFR